MTGDVYIARFGHRPGGPRGVTGDVYIARFGHRPGGPRGVTGDVFIASSHWDSLTPRFFADPPPPTFNKKMSSSKYSRPINISRPYIKYFAIT